MRMRNRKRVSKAWILLLALMPLMLVKSFHHHDSHAFHASCHLHEDSSPQVGADTIHTDCLICHFFLSPALDVSFGDINVAPGFILVKQRIIQENPLTRTLFFASLRAPPVDC